MTVTRLLGAEQAHQEGQCRKLASKCRGSCKCRDVPEKLQVDGRAGTSGRVQRVVHGRVCACTHTCGRYGARECGHVHASVCKCGGWGLTDQGCARVCASVCCVHVCASVGVGVWGSRVRVCYAIHQDSMTSVLGQHEVLVISEACAAFRCETHLV